MSVVIKTKNLYRSFRDGSGNEIQVLKGIDAEFSADQTVSIIGSSGSGKSTLLHLLGGLDHPTSGEVFFKGQNIYEFDSDTLASWRCKNVGFVFQSHHLLPDFTALENVMLPGLIAGMSKQQSIAKAEILLKQVGLNDRATHKPGQLSGGEQQRIAIARALLNSPDVILADEPTGNLDIQTGRKIGTILRQVCHEHQATLIMVTHNLQLAKETDLQLILKDGVLAVSNQSASQ
jgi:lipoprotein-releasing system ATP-binding protein